MSKSRIYTVRIFIPNQTVFVVRLVDAISESQAVRHALKGIIQADVATQADLVKYLSQGVKVENARQEPQGEVVDASLPEGLEGADNAEEQQQQEIIS